MVRLALAPNYTYFSFSFSRSAPESVEAGAVGDPYRHFFRLGSLFLAFSINPPLGCSHAMTMYPPVPDMQRTQDQHASGDPGLPRYPRVWPPGETLHKSY